MSIYLLSTKIVLQRHLFRPPPWSTQHNTILGKALVQVATRLDWLLGIGFVFQKFVSDVCTVQTSLIQSVTRTQLLVARVRMGTSALVLIERLHCRLTKHSCHWNVGMKRPFFRPLEGRMTNDFLIPNSLRRFPLSNGGYFRMKNNEVDVT